MLEIRNNTTKEEMLRNVTYGNIRVNLVEKGETSKRWRVQLILCGRCDSWEMAYLGVPGEYYFKNDEFTLKLYFESNRVILKEAIEKGRTLKANRLLKKFSSLAVFANSLYIYGYLTEQFY